MFIFYILFVQVTVSHLLSSKNLKIRKKTSNISLLLFDCIFGRADLLYSVVDEKRVDDDLFFSILAFEIFKITLREQRRYNTVSNQPFYMQNTS